MKTLLLAAACAALPLYAQLNADTGNLTVRLVYQGNPVGGCQIEYSTSIGYFPCGGSVTDVELADVDADGDRDILVGRSGAGNEKLTVFRNTGSGGVSSSTANGTYPPGSTITILVPFSEAVTVDTSAGIPTLQLETGGTDRNATDNVAGA